MPPPKSLTEGVHRPSQTAPPSPPAVRPSSTESRAATTTESVQPVLVQNPETGTDSTTTRSGVLSSTSTLLPETTDVPSASSSESTGLGAEPTGVPGVGVGGENQGEPSGGLPPGAIAGIVVGLLLLLALLALLLFKFRRSLAVERMLASFRKLGKTSNGFHPYTRGNDGMDNTLLNAGGAGPTPAGGTGTAAAIAPTFSHRADPNPQPPQPPMRQTSRLRPLIPAALSRHDSRRVSIFSTHSIASTAFTPSPVSPTSPNSFLSPGPGTYTNTGTATATGIVRTSHPQHQPPDPRIIPPADARLSTGSFGSSIASNEGTAVSAGLAPGQMAWQVPVGTPAAVRSADGSAQYVNFQRVGETVVRIEIPGRRGRNGEGSGGGGGG